MKQRTRTRVSAVLLFLFFLFCSFVSSVSFFCLPLRLSLSLSFLRFLRFFRFFVLSVVLSFARSFLSFFLPLLPFLSVFLSFVRSFFLRLGFAFCFFLGCCARYGKTWGRSCASRCADGWLSVRLPSCSLFGEATSAIDNNAGSSVAGSALLSWPTYSEAAQ